MFCYDRGFSNRLKHDFFSEFLFHTFNIMFNNNDSVHENLLFNNKPNDVDIPKQYK